MSKVSDFVELYREAKRRVETLDHATPDYYEACKDLNCLMRSGLDRRALDAGEPGTWRFFVQVEIDIEAENEAHAWQVMKDRIRDAAEDDAHVNGVIRVEKVRSKDSCDESQGNS